MQSNTDDGLGPWVKIYQKILEWEWYNDSHMVHIVLHLLIKANWQEKKWRGVSVGKGQIVTSLESISEQTGISVRSVRTCLQRLENCGFLTSKTTNRFRVITICNYDNYQSSKTTERQADCQTNDKQTTSKRQTTDKQTTTTTEYIEYTERIDNNSLSTARTRVCEAKKVHLELENDQIALEGFAMSLRAPMAKLLDLLERFKGWAIGTGEPYGNYTDYRRKFYTWASIEINHDKKPTYQKHVGGPINPPSYGISGRRNPQTQTDFP